MPSRFVVDISNGALREAVEAHLTAHPETRVRGDDALNVVICTTRDLTPEACRLLSHDSTRVLVLAAIPRPEEQASYESAGASYLPMELRSGSLGRWIDEALASRSASPSSNC